MWLKFDQMIDVEEKCTFFCDERMLSPECLHIHHFYSIARRKQAFENERYDYAMHKYDIKFEIGSLVEGLKRILVF